MKSRPLLFGRFLLPAAALISFCGSALAANGTWNGTTSAIWQLNSNWSGATFPGTGNIATFNNAGNGNTTLDIGTGLVVGSILFDTSSAAAYTIGSGAVNSQTLNLNDAGTITVNSTVTNNELFNSTITLGSATTGTSSFINNSATNSLTFAGNVQGGTGGTAAAKTLTIGGAGNTLVSGIISNGGATSLALSKAGAGTLTLTKANTYTGNTTISSGILKLDFTAGGAPATNIISSSSVLKLGGGTLQILGASGGSTQTFASTSFTASTGGQSVISAATASGTNPVINLGVLGGSQGALVRFDGAAYNNGASSGVTVGGNTVAATATITATANTGTGGIIMVQSGTAANGTNSAMAYGTVGLYDWAAISGAGASAGATGTIVGLSQNSGYTVANGNLPSSFGANIDMTASGQTSANSTSAGAAYSTVRFNTNAAVSLGTGRALGGAVIGAILVTPNVGAFNTAIAPQTGTGANTTFQSSRSTNASTGLTVWQNNTLGALNITATYANGSNSAATASYTQGGAGTVFLTPTSGANAYTGQTYLNGGTTVISAFSGLGGGSAPATLAAVNLNGGTIFGNAASVSTDFSGSVLRAVNLNGVGGTLAASAGNSLTVGGLIGGGATAPLTIGTGTIAGTGAGTANATAVIGSGTVSLTGANSYAGGTIAKAGTLQINGINALGGANYGGLTFDGGTLKYATGFSGNGSGDLTSIGTAGVTIASGGGTIDTNGNSVTYAGSIGNGGSGSLTKSGAGTLTLGGANTYTGGTIVSGGTLTAGNSSVFGTGALTIGSGGTLSSGGFNLGVGATTLSGSANILLSGISSQITSSGAISISGSSNVLTLGGGAATAGNTYTLLSGTSLSAAGISLTGTAVGGSTVALGSSSTVGRTNYAFSAVGSALQLGVTGGAFNLTWNGGNANWNTTDANWQKDGIGSNIVFFTGDNITISTGNSIAVDGGGVTTGTLVVNNASGTATLTGGTVTAVSLVKSEAGTLQLGNTISGATLAVSAGELALGAQNQSFANVSLTSGSITGSTAVLTGTGSAFDLQAGSVSATLNGSVGLNKTTGGTVTLSGANTYTGTTSVTTGTLAISGSGTLGNGAALTLGGGTVALGGSSQTVGAVSITAAATSGNTIENGSLTGTSYAASNASDNAIVTANLLANGAAGLTKSGAGTLTLSGANTYTGATLVKNGSLVLDGGANRLLNTGSAVIGDVATAGKLILGGTTVVNQAFTGLTTIGLGGSVVGGTAANSTLTLGIASTNTFGGTLGGAGTNENNLALIKSGVGTLTLSVGNTYTGGTQLNGGTLALGSSSAAGTGTITATNGTTISALSGVGSNTVGNAIVISGTDANVTLLSNNVSGGFSSSITGSADQTLTISNAGGTVVNMNAANKEFQNFLGTVSVASGQSLAFRATSLNNGGDNTLFTINGSLSTRNAGAVALGALTGSGTLGMGSAGLSGQNLTYTIGARATDATFSGVIQDGDTVGNKLVNVTKTGAGGQTLSGASTYTGATTVSAGSLLINGSLGNTAVAVNSGGTLAGSNGTIGSGTAAVTVNTGGTLAPGNSPGTLTVNGSTTLKSGSTYAYQYTGGASAADLLDVNGALTINVGAILTLQDLGAYTSGDKFTLFAYESLTGSFAAYADDQTYAINGGDWTFNYNDSTAGLNGGTVSGAAGSGFVTMTAVPEPDAAMLVGGLGLLALLRRRRNG